MPLSVRLRRSAYRLAFLVLRAWWLVRRPAVRAVKCVLTDGERVLLVRHTYRRAEWDLPGGALKRHEPPIRGARREIREELGLSLEELEPLGEVWTSIHRCRNTLHCFRAEVSAPALHLDYGELEAAAWFHRDQLPPNVSALLRPILDLVK